jgi:cardiolipin synthase (CMP-forming)
VPNFFSLLRILMIPLIVWLYLSERVWWAAAMVGVSALTDGIDGYIARHYNQITPLGKVLDPLADKLTQVAIAVFLIKNFPVVIPLAVVLAIKELLMLSWGLTLLRAGQPPFSARWWGKLATGTFYVGTVLVILYGEQLGAGGRLLVFFTLTMLMLFSMLRYGQLFRDKIRQAA